MPEFSERSASRLRTCDPLLQGVLHEVVLAMDCTILEGHRSRQRQEALFEAGK